MQNIDLEEYKQLVGQSLGVSRWFEMDQPRIDRFAELSQLSPTSNLYKRDLKLLGKTQQQLL